MTSDGICGSQPEAEMFVFVWFKKQFKIYIYYSLFMLLFLLVVLLCGTEGFFSDVKMEWKGKSLMKLNF